MKKILTLFSVVLLFSAIAVSVNSGIQPLADNEIQFQQVSSLPASTDLTFTPDCNGTLKIFAIGIQSWAFDCLFSEPNGVGDIYNDGINVFDSPSSSSIYPSAKGTQAIYEVTAGTTYYMYDTKGFDYYAVFVPAGGGNTGSLIEIELDQATTIPVDQKGIFHCDFTGQLQVQTVTMQGNFAQQQRSFLFTDEACEDDVPVVSAAAGFYFDTFVYEVEAGSDYYVYYDDSKESSITYTFINLGSVVVPEVTFDERVQYEQGTDYLIAVDGDCQIAIETAATLTEQELLYGMIYYKNGGANQSVRDYIVKDAGFNTLYIFTLKGSPDNIYYFSCKKTANYTFTIYTAPDEEPSTATAKITNPLTDVKTFANFVIVWDNYLTITNGSMLGATITGPDNETYNVTRYTIGAADDGHDGDNSLSLSFSPQAEANGTYTIYLPKGVVYIDGKPNKEQTLTFTHQWVPDFLDYATLINDELTTEDNSVKLTWSNTPVRLNTSSPFEIPVRYNGEQIGVINDEGYLTLENEDGSASDGLGTVLDISLGMAGLLEGPGNYEFDLPQGLVEDDGIISPAQTIYFTITGGSEPSDQPVQIEMNKATDLIANQVYFFTPSESGNLVVSTNGWSYPSGDLFGNFIFTDATHINGRDYDNMEYGDSGLIFIYNNIEAANTYYLYFTEPSDGLTATLTMVKAAEPQAVNYTTIYPAVGELEEDPSFIEIYYAETLGEGENYSNITINGETLSNDLLTIDGTILNINTNGYSGKINLVIPEKALVVGDNGDWNEAVDLTWTVAGYEEPVAVANDYLGSITGQSTEVLDVLDYVLNYMVVYNEDKTLTISGKYIWPGNQTPTGYTGEIMVNLPGRSDGDLPKNEDGTFNTGTLTFNEGETIQITFWVAAAGGRVSETINYVVGRPFNVQLKEDPKQEGTIENADREISIRTANQEAELMVNAPQGATVYYQLSDVVNTQTRAIEGYTEASGNVIKLTSNTSGNLSLYYSLNGEDSEPVTYAYNVLYDLSTGVEGIDAANEEGAEFFNLQGLKVKNPESGLYIKVVNGKATKVLVRK